MEQLSPKSGLVALVVELMVDFKDVQRYLPAVSCWIIKQLRFIGCAAEYCEPSYVKRYSAVWLSDIDELF